MRHRKICTRCKQNKEISEFSKDALAKDGYRYGCKVCLRKARKIPTREQKDIENLRDKERRANNPEFAEKRWNKDLEKKYGITSVQYDQMLEQQDHRCAICKSLDSGGNLGMKWPIDHCHKTGLVRGLLCTPCNIGLGKFSDNRGLIRQAIIYLKGCRVAETI